MRRTLLVLGLLVAVVVTAAAATETEPATGSIDVDKDVDGEPDCPDDEPCFVVEIDCADQVTRRQVYDRTGHLIEGPSTFHDIPKDTVCVVTETVTAGAVVTYDPAHANTTGVVITPEDPDSDEDQRVHVLVTNTFCEYDCEPPPTTVPSTTVPSTTVPTTTVPTTVPPPTSSIPTTTVPPPPPTTDPPTTTVPPTTDPTTTTMPCEPPGYDDCTTTTTTVPPPPTTDPQPPPTTDPPATTDPPPELARTGSDHLRPWAAAGLILATLGAALVIVTRKRVTG